MAKHLDWNNSMLPDFRRWRDERPLIIQAVIDKLPPWNLYLLKTSGHRVTIYAYDENEDGTVSLQVNIEGRYNLIVTERRVFGVKPEDLEECDLPKKDEDVGSLGIPMSVIKELRDMGGGAACSVCKTVWTDDCDVADHVPIPMFQEKEE
jgi:hypothetical protein